MSNDKTDIAQSLNPAEQLKRELARIAPEAFSEGRLDVNALRRALGEEVIEGGERYRLDWAGKSDAYKVLQTPTTATLRPQRELSVNFDSAEHVFIEGENLEVLKVLQKAYFGKVKLIYIDPPYNTGSDSFVYPDRFQETKEEYLKRIDALDDDGSLMREGAFRKNSRENGHYHSNWLSMMLPRLYIARNLLREDGVIFVSCDDNEVHNLRCLMNEVFGEENFVATIIWEKADSPRDSAKMFSTDHDYVLLYSKQSDWISNRLERTEESNSIYSNPDDDPRGPWLPGDPYANKPYSKGTYTIVGPTGRSFSPPPGRYWRISEEKLRELDRDGRVWWGPNGNARPSIKRYLSEVSDLVPRTLWSKTDVGSNRTSKNEVRKHFPDAEAFDTPKPVALIQRMLQLATSSNDDSDLVMDFFGGSATTTEAVMRQNLEDGGTRRSIVVQLPEPISMPKSGIASISELARGRIAAAIRSFSPAGDGFFEESGNLGFRAFQLTPSNLKQWRGDDIDSADALAQQIALFADSKKAGAAAEDIFYELLLKFGQELTTPVATLEIDGRRVFSIHDNAMLFVLDGFSEAMIQPLVALKPREIVALDAVFAGSDQLKSNLELQCRDAGIRMTSV
jgi:adenine-specific DNA-methyltransferase